MEKKIIFNGLHFVATSPFLFFLIHFVCIFGFYCVVVFFVTKKLAQNILLLKTDEKENTHTSSKCILENAQQPWHKKYTKEITIFVLLMDVAICSIGQFYSQEIKKVKKKRRRYNVIVNSDSEKFEMKKNKGKIIRIMC